MKIVLALLACSSFVAAAPVYQGAAGQAPAQVALSYLQNKISNSAGQFEYQGLDIKQRSQGEDFSRTQLTVEIKGLMDDSVASERYRFSMALVDGTWQINKEQQDHRCRRGARAYSQKPCP